MTAIQAIILGIVQGLTEFLPISSSAHLVLVPKLFGWQPFLGNNGVQVSFDVFLHFASLIAVVYYFRDDLIKLIASFKKDGDPTQRRIGMFLVIATLPVVFLGFVFMDFFKSLFEKPFSVSIQLIATGLILLTAESITRPHKPLEKITFFDSLAIGLAQVLAIIPGISRSGATVGAGMWSGLKREEAAKFSFLLSIPAIFGATIFSLADLRIADVGVSFFIGFLSSLIVSYLAIKYFIEFLKKGNLRIFALYCIVVGLIFAAIIGFNII